MKCLISFFSLILFQFTVLAQGDGSVDEEERPSSLSISVSMENAFGFYPAVYGSFGLNDKMDFTYYGVFWTNPAFGMPAVNFSSDLWLESGVGLGFDALGGTAYINPSLGFTHGKFLSGGEESVLGDGIVPSVIAYFFPGKFDGEVYFGYYRHLRDESPDSSAPNTSDFLFYWVYPGIWVSEKISIGIHYEGLFLNYGQTEMESYYQWLGPYIKFQMNSAFFRFSAGANLEEDEYYSREFYKLSVYLPLDL